MSDDRGQYRPIDPSRNPVINWGAEVGAEHAKWSAVDFAMRPVAPVLSAVDRGIRAHDGARGVYRGAQVLGGFGSPSLSWIGQDWWHGAEDRQRALAQISTDFTAIATDLQAAFKARRDAAAAHPTPAAAAALDADVHWLAADIQPTLEEWKAFVAREQESVWTLVATSWETFLGWQERVRRLRELARARGFKLSSPEPVTLPKTVWERGAEGAGGPAAWLGLLKISIAAVVGIAGFVGLYSAFKR